MSETSVRSERPLQHHDVLLKAVEHRIERPGRASGVLNGVGVARGSSVQGDDSELGAGAGMASPTVEQSPVRAAVCYWARPAWRAVA